MAEIINFPTPQERTDRFWAPVVDELSRLGYEGEIVNAALKSAINRIDQSQTIKFDVTFRSYMSKEEVIEAALEIARKAREPLMTQVIVLEVMLAYARLGKSLPD